MIRCSTAHACCDFRVVNARMCIPLIFHVEASEHLISAVTTAAAHILDSCIFKQFDDRRMLPLYSCKEYSAGGDDDDDDDNNSNNF